MSSTATPEQPDALLGWHKRYPARWREEITELRETGWPFKVVYRSGRVGLRIDYPLPPHPAPGIERLVAQSAAIRWVRLQVRFEQTYPFFPPIIIDRDNGLGPGRHRSADGHLCLVHDRDFRVEWTVARLLTEQMPKLLRAGAQRERPQAPSTDAHAVRAPGGREGDLAAPVRGEDELRVPAGQVQGMRYPGPAILVPPDPVPANAEQGLLAVRYVFDEWRPHIGTGLLTSIQGPGVDIETDAIDQEYRQYFPVVSRGRWIRDPDFEPMASADATWRRIRSRLHPLVRGPADAHSVVADPSRLHTVGLLVPDEIGYREAGETWVFLLRLRHDATEGRSARWSTHLCNSQVLARTSFATRTPAATKLRTRSVVVVGLGAIGHHLAYDLGLSGVGTLDLVDADHVDVATANRQPAPAAWAGESKTWVVRDVIKAANPWCRVRDFSLDVSRLWERQPDPRVERYVSGLRRRLLTSDLVLDATADPAVTRWLSALRVARGRAFLHVSATAGAFGGLVYLQRPETGCWECVERWRAAAGEEDGSRRLPVPSADPNGWVQPTRCGEVTFTGTRAEVATVAHHASRVATHHLIGDAGLGGDYYVANLRDAYGQPIPVTWRAVPLPQHPACSARHATRAADSLGRRAPVPGEERSR